MNGCVLTTVSLSNLELTRLFSGIVLLILLAHTFGYLFQRLKLPRVIGEITAGLLLGPTVLGLLAPQAYRWLFSAFEAEGPLISMIYWLGLVLLMFVSGFEIQRSLNRDDRKIIIALTIGSTVVPFVAGWIAPHMYDFSPYLGDKKNLLALKLIIAIATAVTSIPVLTKIFIDLNIINTSFAKIVLSTATVHDVILWVALAIATGIVSSESSSLSEILYHVTFTIIFFGVALLVMPRVFKVLHESEWNILMRSSVAGYILIICFSFSAVASILNVNVVFGAMLAGVVVGMAPERFEKERTHIKEMSLAFFIPLYFAIVGLKLDLVHHLNPLFLVGFLLFTTAFQMLGTMGAARMLKQDWLSSFNLGIALTDRGGPAIVLATVAFDLGIINETFFVTLVLIAIITSLTAGTWFRYLLVKGYPLLKSKEVQQASADQHAPFGREGVVKARTMGSGG